MADDSVAEQTSQPDQQNEQSIAPNHDVNEKRNMVCFWIVGLCNTYGPMVLLSAAYDIIKRLNGVSVRNCPNFFLGMMNKSNEKKIKCSSC